MSNQIYHLDFLTPIGNLLKHYRERHPGCNPPECYSEKTSEGDGYSESAGGDIDLDSIEAISESNMDSNLTRASDSVKSMDGMVEVGVMINHLLHASDTMPTCWILPLYSLCPCVVSLLIVQIHSYMDEKI